MHIYDNELANKKFLFFFCISVVDGYYNGVIIDSDKNMHQVRIPDRVYKQIPRQFKNNPHLGWYYNFEVGKDGSIKSNLLD